MSETLVLKHGIVMTIDGRNKVLEDGAVVIRDDRILDVGETKVIEKKYRADQVIDASWKAVIPGLVNTHVHSGLSRGSGDDLPLHQWLERDRYPEHKALRPEDVYLAAKLCFAESIKCGTTCILQHDRFMDKCADAAEEIGIRVVLAPEVSDADAFHEKHETNVDLIKNRHGSAEGRINVWCGLDSPSECSLELLSKARACADKYGVGIHIHANETSEDVKSFKKKHGKRPIEHLHKVGVTGSDVVMAHCIWLSNSEIRILKSTRTNVAHCPVSNMKLADGAAPIPRLMNEGVNVSLATDGSLECNSFDMFRVMKTTSLLHRVNQLDATIMPAKSVLRMATWNGAKSLGLQKDMGSVEPGKKADLVLVDLNKPHLATALLGDHFNVDSHLVYSAVGSDVDTVIIDGKVVMENRVLKTVDESALIQEARKTAGDLQERKKQFIPSRLKGK